MADKIKNGYRKLRDRVPLPLILVGALMIVMLTLNEETSFTRNYEYIKEIKELQKEIKLNEDSARYYSDKRKALCSSTDDLEHIAREQYHMQRRVEDVYIVKE